MPDLEEEAQADEAAGAPAHATSSTEAWEPSDEFHHDTAGPSGLVESDDRQGAGKAKGKGKAGRGAYRPRVTKPERVQRTQM